MIAGKGIMLNNEFTIGQVVYLKTDPDQLPRIVLRILISSNGYTYEIGCGMLMSYHYEHEISEEVNVLAKI